MCKFLMAGEYGEHSHRPENHQHMCKFLIYPLFIFFSHGGSGIPNGRVMKDDSQ